MYKYEYVPVEEKKIKYPCFWGYKDIIDERAADGWRYVGFVPTAMTMDGRMYKIDLIFEKAIEE